MSENISEGAAELALAVQHEEMKKFVAPISGNRRLYFYTFGDELLELPPDSVEEEAVEAHDV